MSAPWISEADSNDRFGWAHVAISLGSEDKVDELAGRLEVAGLLLHSPRYTGDGFYEAVIRMPPIAEIELTA